MSAAGHITPLCVPALAAEMGMPIGDVVTDGAHSLVFRLMEDGTN